MFSIINMELGKLVKSRLYVPTLVSLFIFVIVAMVIMYYKRSTDTDLFTLIYSIFAFNSDIFFPVVAIAFFSSVVTKEYQNKTIKLLVGSSIPRSNIILGKFFSAALSFLLLFFTVILTSFAVALLLSPEQVTYINFEDIGVANIFLRTVIAMISTAVFLISFGGFGYLLALWTKSQAVTMLISIGVLLFYVIVPIPEWFKEYSFIGKGSMFYTAVTLLEIPYLDIIKVILICLLYLLVFLISSVMYFQRLQIKEKGEGKLGTSRKWIISLLGLSFVIVIALISLNFFARENPSSKKSESMEEKISRLEKYTKDNKKDAKAHLELALYYYHNKEYDKSVSENKKALKLKPNDSLAWQRLGNTYVFQEKFEEAKKAREQVVKYVKEPSGWSYVTLSSLTVLDDPAAALEQSQKALEIAKGFEDARLGPFKSWVSTLKTYVDLIDKKQVGAAYVNLVTNNITLEKPLVLKYIDEALASGELSEEQKNRILDVQEKVRDFDFHLVNVTEDLGGEQ